MTLQVFAATTQTQGQRENDFCLVPEDELVIFPVITCSNQEPDDSCGCRRAMCGVTCKYSTSTVKVISFARDEVAYQEIVQQALDIGGWTIKKKHVHKMTQELLDLASTFEVGDVVEIRGDDLKVRSIA